MINLKTNKENTNKKNTNRAQDVQFPFNMEEELKAERE